MDMRVEIPRNSGVKPQTQALPAYRHGYEWGYRWGWRAGLHRGWLHAAIFGFAILVIALLSGCATPAERYIRADAKTYNLVAPQLLEEPHTTAPGDPDATDSGWLATVETWRARIDEAARAAGIALDLWSAPEPSRVPAAEPSRGAGAADRDGSPEVIRVR